jgi:hypothetical protein
MILVAVVAIATGAEVMRRRRAVYLAYAEYYSEREDRARRAHDEALASAAVLPRFGSAADSFGKLADYDASMRRKYERAADYPFLPVAPDPPDPLNHLVPPPRSLGPPLR